MVWLGVLALTFSPASASAASTLARFDAVNDATDPLPVLEPWFAEPARSLEELAYAAAPAPAPDDAGQNPPVIVVARRENWLEEEALVGSYGQPEWTTKRRFSSTRIYVKPENTVGVEYWFIFKKPKHGSGELIHQAEIEIGLPGRFQLDLYLVGNGQEGDSDINIDEMFEIRWALADWGKIWGNPALYAEFVNRESEPEKVELKLLLGDELAPRWHWGLNFVWEAEVSGAREHEYELTSALSYSVVDKVFSIGIEGKFSVADEKDNRGHFEENIRLGPSLQWRPCPKMHIDVAPLFGLTHDSRKLDLYFIVGYDF